MVVAITGWQLRHCNAARSGTRCRMPETEMILLVLAVCLLAAAAPAQAARSLQQQHTTITGEHWAAVRGSRALVRGALGVRR